MLGDPDHAQFDKIIVTVGSWDLLPVWLASGGSLVVPLHWREPRDRARDLLVGLLFELSIKNCWMITEHVGNATPDGLVRLRDFVILGVAP